MLITCLSLFSNVINTNTNVN